MNLPGRAYLLAERVIRHLAPRLHSRWAGLWLGVLGRRGLSRIDQAKYSRRGRYQGAEHNLRGLFEWERAAVERYFAGRERIVVLGAGGGREVLALWRMGFRPQGFECNPDLVRAAGQILPAQGCPARVDHVARDRAPDVDGPFDGAIIGWGAYMLVMGRETRLELLRGMRRLVPEGAPLLLSFFTRGEGERRAPEVARLAGRVRRLLRRPPAETGDDMLPGFVHRFTRGELEEELAAAGFRLMRWQPQGEGPRDTGWGVATAI